MANLTGQELVDRLYDIGLLDTHVTLVTDDAQFSPNHINNPAVPESLSKVLVTNQTNIIQAINELKLNLESMDISVNQKLNSQFAVLGDYLTYPHKRTGLESIDEDVLEALLQIQERLSELEPQAPIVEVSQISPTTGWVSVATTDITIPLSPVDGEFTITEQSKISLIKNNGSVLLDTVSSIQDFNNLRIHLNQPLEVGEDYTLTIGRKAIRNGAVYNLVEYTSSFSIAFVPSTPVLDISSATPAGASVNYLTTDKIEIPIISTNHLNDLVVDDSKITVNVGSTSYKSLSKSSEVVGGKLVIYTQLPLVGSSVYDVVVSSGALADGGAINSSENYSFTTEASSPETTLQKSFTVSYGVRLVKEEEIEVGLDLSSFITMDDVYNSSSNFDVSERKVYLFKKRETGGALDISIVKLSNEYNPSLDSNDWGSFYDINVDRGELYFGHDLIEKFFEYEIVSFSVKKSSADAIAWATANLV